MSLRDSTKEDLVVRRYYEDLYTISPSTAEMAFVAAMPKTQRSIAYATIPPFRAIRTRKSPPGDRRTPTSSKPTASPGSPLRVPKPMPRKCSSRFATTSSPSRTRPRAILRMPTPTRAATPATCSPTPSSRDSLKKEDAAKVLALPKGDVSDVFKIADKAWAFFRINTDPRGARLHESGDPG